MLTIRMQRLGRKGHPTYRVVVQDVRQAPTSGKYVALLGSYDPHLKTTTLSKEKAEFYLTHGAQPSDRVVRLFTSEGIKIPKWVKKPAKQTSEIRNPEKLRRNRPAEEVSAPEQTDAPSAETSSANETTEATELSEVSSASEAPEEAPAEAAETGAAEPEEAGESEDSEEKSKA